MIRLIDSVGRHQKISIDDEDVDEVSFFLVTSMHDWIGFMKSFARVEYCTVSNDTNRIVKELMAQKARSD